MCSSQETTTTSTVIRKRKLEEHQEENANTCTSMTLTKEERIWASDLKSAFENCSDVKNTASTIAVSDLEFVHYALATKGDTEAALERLQHLQAFRTNHGIQNKVNAEEALLVLDKFMDEYPGALLKIDECPPSKQGTGYFVVLDVSAILSTSASSNSHTEDRNTVAEAFHVVRHCLFPHFDAMRVGSTHIVDFDNLELDEANIASLRNLWNDCGCHSPMSRFKEAWLYNTPPKTGSALTTLCQKVMKAETLDKIYIGCQMEVGGVNWSLKNLFLLPNEQEAKMAVLEEAERLLKERCANEAAFSL